MFARGFAATGLYLNWIGRLLAMLRGETAAPESGALSRRPKNSAEPRILANNLGILYHHPQPHHVGHPHVPLLNERGLTTSIAALVTSMMGPMQSASRLMMTAVEKHVPTVAALIWVAGRYELVIRVDLGLSVLGCVASLGTDRLAGQAHR